MMKNLVRLLTIAMILLLSYSPGDATVRYVRVNGTPASAAGQATSWASACSDLQAVINVSAQSGDEIWVAAGTYKPTQLPPVNPGTTTTDRDKTFLIRKNIKILGGFPATGNPTASDRNWATNPTILSGDFNNNDVVTGQAATLSITGNDENAHHVIIIMNLGPNDINQSRLDGFQIKGGYANRSTNLSIPLYSGVAATTINGAYGAGLYINSGQPTIINCKFSGNKSSYGGSGIENCGTSTNIANCLFEKCESVNNYGAISNSGSNCSASIINSTIAGCKDYGMYVSISSPQITNTIIMDNSQGGIRTNQDPLDNPAVSFSLIQGRAASADSNNLNGNTITATQVFTNPANGDYSLLSTSPARNTGNNMAYNGMTTANNFGDYDLAHNPRFEGNTIDMGPYEYRFQNIPVTGITLNRQTLSMSLGSFSGTELIATIAPANATNQNINWTSSNPNIVSVVSGQSPRNPILGALAVGTSTITATSAEGGFTATCLVTVATPPPPSGIPVIELTTTAPTAGVSVPISMKAAAIRTPVWIETAQGVYTQVTIGTDWSTVVNYSPSNTSLKIHGAIIGLNCSGPGFTPGVVTGINASGDTALQELSCFNNQITNLNLNGLNSLKELSCYKNQLTNLNITGRNALKELSCSQNQLTSLNLTGLTALRSIYCGDNLLTNLNLTGLSAIQALGCYNNQITNLNLSGLNELRHLNCYGNPFSNTTAGLDNIYCQLPQRTANDNATIVVTNTTQTPSFVLATNGANANGKNWTIHGGSSAVISNTTGGYICGTPTTPPQDAPVIELTTTAPTPAAGVSVPIRMKAAAANTPVWIETAPNTYTIVYVGTEWSDVANYSPSNTSLKILGAITGLRCHGANMLNVGKITALNASGNTNLEYLDCSLNQITSLNLTGLNALKDLLCYYNQLSSLNLSGLTALKTLSCGHNQLPSLNLSGLNDINVFLCEENQIASLNISGLNALSYFSCYNNPFSNTTAGLDNIYCQLPQRTPNDNAKIYVTKNSSVPAFVLATNRANANNKNWTLKNVVGDAAITNTTGNYVCGTISVTGITLNRQTLPMDVGATANSQIVATIAPADATNKNITWTSSNPDIVSVVSGQFPSTPILQALAIGTSTITATTADGGFTATCLVTVSPIQVTGVTLNEQSLTLTVGDNESLIASILPQNATNRNVTWTSSNPAVASVQTTPVPLNAAINALSPGTTTITVTTQDGSWTATCNVRVNAQIISVAEVILTPNTLEMTVGTEEALTATVYPTNATNQNVTWTSSNAQIASVNNGVVTALAPGTATITVTTQDGNRTSTCAITVIPNTVRVTNVTLNTQNIVMIAGDETQLTATISPANATNQNVTWSSSNTNVASINANGIINALSAGEAVMTVTTVDGLITATCNVRVNAATVAVTGVTLNNTILEITEGSTATLVANISPSNASNKNVNWTSTSPSVALVNANGVVSGMSQGNAIIMVTTQDGGHIASCSVRVTRNQIAVTDITLTPTNLQVYLGEEGTITANITPDNATNKNINWTSANPNVATVNNGVVRGLKLGETTINATTQDGGLVASSIVTVNQRIIQDTSVKLNKKTLYLAVGKNEKLNATILPENTTNKGLTWHSIDASIASIEKDGEVRAIRVGETKVVVSTFNGNTDTCKVIVSQYDVPVTAVTMDIAQTTINTGEKKKLTVIFTPANATNQLVAWYSSNPKVASVDENGNITGLSAGTTTIAAKSKDGNFTATCEITVIQKDIAVTSIKLNKTTIGLNVGERVELDATIEPENATNQDMNWTSSDPSIVKVDGYGAIQALKKGEATITVTSTDGGKTATCKVTVTEKKIFVTGITITVKNLQIEQGGTAKLLVVITPADATNKLITWFSSNQNVVRVDANGNITAVGPGNATITVKTEDGGKVATCQVTVTKKVSVENERIDSGVRVWTENDVININIKDAKSNINNVEIYNMLGNCVFQTNSPNTEMRIELQSGVYFIRVGDTTHKVVLTR